MAGVKVQLGAHHFDGFGDFAHGEAGRLGDRRKPVVRKVVEVAFNDGPLHRIVAGKRGELEHETLDEIARADTSGLQAFVFTVLTTIYILLMLPHEEHGHEGEAQHAH